MRAIIAAFVFVAFLLAAADVTNSMRSHEVQLLTVGDGIRTLLLATLGKEAVFSIDSSNTGAIAFAVRLLHESPAVAVALILAALMWLMKQGAKWFTAAKSVSTSLVKIASPIVAPSHGSEVTAKATPIKQDLASGSGKQMLAGEESAAPLRTIVEAPPSPPAKPLLVTTTDREFLPASLEILLTPSSPTAAALQLTICGAFAIGLAWSYFSWIDIHAVAIGKVQPSGRSKVVQPLEAGKVVTIRVENGATVTAGEILLELDPTETGADREALARDLEAANAEIARRSLALVVAEGPDLRARAIAFDAGTSEQVRRRETAVLVADLSQLRAIIASTNAQLAEKRATKLRLGASIEAREKSIALSKERVDMRTEIDTRGAGSRAMIIESLQQYETLITTDAGERGQLFEIDAAMVSLERKTEEAVSQFVADQTQKLAEIERKRERLVQELVKAQSKSDRTQLRAPISGTVQQLNVTTVGQVVASGQSLLTVVPLDGPIEVEAMITNKDIGFVEIGQSAVIKVEAFPFTRYGTINSTVAKVSRDAVDDRGSSGLSDVANTTKPQGLGAVQNSQTSNLVFPTTLALAQRTIRVDGKDIALMPGMTVSVEIKTGQRRAIDYVLSPLREITARTAHER